MKDSSIKKYKCTYTRKQHFINTHRKQIVYFFKEEYMKFQNFLNKTAVTENVDEKLKRVKKDWEHIAKEPIDVSEAKGLIIGVGSELAILRLFYKYNQVDRNKKTRMSYNKPANIWSFSIDTAY